MKKNNDARKSVRRPLTRIIKRKKTRAKISPKMKIKLHLIQMQKMKKTEMIRFVSFRSKGNQAYTSYERVCWFSLPDRFYPERLWDRDKVRWFASNLLLAQVCGDIVLMIVTLTAKQEFLSDAHRPAAQHWNDETQPGKIKATFTVSVCTVGKSLDTFAHILGESVWVVRDTNARLVRPSSFADLAGTVKIYARGRWYKTKACLAINLISMTLRSIFDTPISHWLSNHFTLFWQGCGKEQTQPYWNIIGVLFPHLYIFYSLGLNTIIRVSYSPLAKRKLKVIDVVLAPARGRHIQP